MAYGLPQSVIAALITFVFIKEMHIFNDVTFGWKAGAFQDRMKGELLKMEAGTLETTEPVLPLGTGV